MSEDGALLNSYIFFKNGEPSRPGYVRQSEVAIIFV